MVPGDATGLGSLRQLAKRRDQKHSIAAILTPVTPGYTSLQLLLALSPTNTDADCSLWNVEVHGRMGARTHLLPAPGDGDGEHAMGFASPVNELSNNSDRLSGSLTRPLTERAFSTLTSGLRSSDPSGYTNGSSTDSATSLTIPPRLSTLRVIDLIAKGSFGTVYAGFLQDTPVAIKVRNAAGVIVCVRHSSEGLQHCVYPFGGLISLVNPPLPRPFLSCSY